MYPSFPHGFAFSQFHHQELKVFFCCLVASLRVSFFSKMPLGPSSNNPFDLPIRVLPCAYVMHMLINFICISLSSLSFGSLICGPRSMNLRWSKSIFSSPIIAVHRLFIVPPIDELHFGCSIAKRLLATCGTVQSYNYLANLALLPGPTFLTLPKLNCLVPCLAYHTYLVNFIIHFPICKLRAILHH